MKLFKLTSELNLKSYESAELQPDYLVKITLFAVINDKGYIKIYIFSNWDFLNINVIIVYDRNFDCKLRHFFLLTPEPA